MNNNIFEFFYIKSKDFDERIDCAGVFQNIIRGGPQGIKWELAVVKIIKKSGMETHVLFDPNRNN